MIKTLKEADKMFDDPLYAAARDLLFAVVAVHLIEGIQSLNKVFPTKTDAILKSLLKHANDAEDEATAKQDALMDELT